MTNSEILRLLLFRAIPIKVWHGGLSTLVVPFTASGIGRILF